MVDEILYAIRDWRFPASVVFFGPLLGSALYRVVPPPRGMAIHVVRALRAGVASHLAKRVGAHSARDFAAMVGANEMAAVFMRLRRQRRRIVVGTTLVVALVLAPICTYAPISAVPDWAYVILAAVGVFRLWRVW